VGCALGCTFCASTQAGFKRNLTAGEIVEQVIWISHLLGKSRSLNNIVYMGIGEPLLNYDNVMKSIRLLNNVKGLNFGIRKITLSTSGIIPGIKQLGKEPKPPRLCVSIHSPNNDTRSKLLPVNKKYPLPEVLKEVKAYCRNSKHQVAIEYVLIRGINDSEQDAQDLAQLFKNIPCSFNLIACNHIEDSKLHPSPAAVCEKFKTVLTQAGFRTTLRVRKGTDINAACGQLRIKHKRQT
jgi:23S rRNA (adenine2503-C2)-methyltransferase